MTGLSKNDSLRVCIALVTNMNGVGLITLFDLRDERRNDRTRMHDSSVACPRMKGTRLILTITFTKVTAWPSCKLPPLCLMIPK